MDGRCHLMKLGRGATALIESPQLAKKTGNGIVAVTFQFSSGRVATGAKPKMTIGSVLHVLGHFEKQKDPKSDGFALQQILLNFVLEKQEARRTR